MRRYTTILQNDVYINVAPSFDTSVRLVERGCSMTSLSSSTIYIIHLSYIYIRITLYKRYAKSFNVLCGGNSILFSYVGSVPPGALIGNILDIGVWKLFHTSMLKVFACSTVALQPIKDN